jgi:hypothetical protein
MGSLATLILKLVEIYKREPDAAFRALESPLYAFTDSDSIDPELVDQAVKFSSERDKELVARRTLIFTETNPGPIELRPAVDMDQFLKESEESEDGLEAVAIEEGLTADEYDAKSSLNRILDFDPGIELIRDFAFRLDGAVELIEQLDDARDYQAIPSQTARHFLREAHLNHLYGMESSACILFWSAIEHSLNELLERKGVYFSTVWERLNAAEKHLGLPNDIRVAAQQIYDLRKDAVHDIKKFWSSDGDLRSSVPSNSRIVIAALYGLSEG